MGVEPSRHKIDFRSEILKSEDLHGKSKQTMRENLNTFRSHPHIVACSPTKGGEASVTHHSVLKSIILIRRHPENTN